MVKDTSLVIAGREFRSRLMVGTGKYRDNETMVQALHESGAEVVTVAVRRVDLKRSTGDALLNFIDPVKYFILPNTAGCYTVDEALRTARLAREAGLSEWIKLEVIGDEKTLLPDTRGLVEATKILVAEGFKVMPYTNDDVVVARRLEEAGAVAVMPLASPIGSGMGILNPVNIRFIKEAVKLPVIVDAGVGTASDASIAMELGVDGLLMNTGIAGAGDPVAMARAMRLAVEAGRLAYLAGRIPRKEYAAPSSPTAGLIK
jgi:thiazole synthase